MCVGTRGPSLGDRPMDNNTNKTVLCLILALSAGCSRKQDVHAADNTSRNARDRSGQTLTPTDQSESASDRALTQAIRKSLTEDGSLSTDAKNIKIISRDGRVTLRGVVASEEEKESILVKVRELSGVQGCDDQLEAKTN